MRDTRLLNRRALLASSITMGLGVTARSVSAHPGAPGGRVQAADAPPHAGSDAERTTLEVLDDIDRNQRQGNMIVSVADGRLLRILTESIGAAHVVELGTSVGYSGVWICLALRATDGRLTTYDIDPDRQGRARENFERAGVAELVTPILGDAHVEVTKLKDPIDLLFIDADKDGYPDYLEKLEPLVRPGGLILAHNMQSPPPDPRYVEAITTNPAFDTTFLHMDAAGMGLTLKKHELT